MLTDHSIVFYKLEDLIAREGIDEHISMAGLCRWVSTRYE